MTVAIQTEIGNFGGRAAAFALSLLFSMTACNGVETEITSADQAVQAVQAENAKRITRHGVQVDFKATAVGPDSANRPIRAGEFARLEFTVTGSEDGQPLQGVYPGVWVDLVQTADGERKGVSLDCKLRVSQYMQGLVGMRPMIDLNSYFVMVLNKDPSISVIDPIVGITGITSLYTSIPLKRPGADWTKTDNEKTMFVSIPRSGEVAVIDLDTFKVTQYIPAGVLPIRTVMQPDSRYLWVGNDGKKDQLSGITVIDVETREVIAEIETGAGHHEISISGDGRSAFVSNRDAGTVTVIDVETLSIVATIETGPVPIAMAWSPLSQSLYVADGESGEVVVIDGEKRAQVASIVVKPGLGPIRFSNDGRWGVVVNPNENEVSIIDASTNDVAHTIPIQNKPFQIGMSDTFAYIRSMDSEHVSMINLQELNRGGQVIVNRFAAGSFPPGQVRDLGIADSVVPAVLEAAMLVASPADATVYYYMEGMNAPMGAFRNYGHEPRAVQIANRAMQEVSPGVYATIVKMPMAGTFEVAYLNETPGFLHCFELEAQINPSITEEYKDMDIEYLLGDQQVMAGETLDLKFRLTDPRTGLAEEDLQDVMVKYYRAPRFDLARVPAVHVSRGEYQVSLPIKAAGAYYVYVSVPSRKIKYEDLQYLTLMAQSPAPKTASVLALAGDAK
jgi:YVTN family beta-propeller protein